MKSRGPRRFCELETEWIKFHGLAVPNDLTVPQDLNSWLNFDGLQDHDSIGLEIPMNDLTDLNMLM